MPEQTVVLYVRIPTELDEQLEAWMAETNKTLQTQRFTYSPGLSKRAAVCLLLAEGLRAMGERAAAAAEEAKRAERAAADWKAGANGARKRRGAAAGKRGR